MKLILERQKPSEPSSVLGKLRFEGRKNYCESYKILTLIINICKLYVKHFYEGSSLLG